MPKTIAVTLGEPAGIGADIIAQLAHIGFDSALVVLGDADLLATRAESIGVHLAVRDFASNSSQLHKGDGTLTVLSLPTPQPVEPGVINLANEPYVLQLIDRAIEGANSGEWQAFVTAPVDKAAIIQAGIPFSGHTEYLKQACAVPTVMLLANDSLRVALLTTHIPLKEVAKQITKDKLATTLKVVQRGLTQWFGIANPRIGVCGLNPHAGEQGELGDEEQRVIAPVIEDLRQAGIDTTGPWPADTIFSEHKAKEFDVVVAMFHDQGLPVVKHAGFGRTVNITLGLPFLRTSVDHGTALSIAASGKASCESLTTAVQYAIDLSS